VSSVAAPLRTGIARISPRVWLVALCALALLAAGYMWLRQSSLAAVREVSITGLTSSREASQIRRVLDQTARDMTTLHVREDALRSAVAPFPIVKDIRATGDFPHRLRIEVVEYRPAAVLEVDGRLLPVAGDGTLLRGELGSRDLPKVPVSLPPGGPKLKDPWPLAAVRALGAAPDALRPLVTRARRGPDGLRFELENGPQLIFGTAAEARGKWAAAARVLADPTAKGATYVDVRVPGRAVAGRFPTDSSAVPAPVAPAATAAPAAGPTGQTGPTGAVAGR
jgi:cell division protein FtsQ